MPQDPKPALQKDQDLPRTVQALAEECGVSVRTIHYYQRAGLIPPPTMMGRNAAYSREHVEALGQLRAAIRTAKKAGTLSDLYDGRLAAQGRVSSDPSERVARMENLIRFVVADGVEILVSPERTGLSPSAMQTLISEISIFVSERVRQSTTRSDLSRTASPETLPPTLEMASPQGTARLLEKLRLTNEEFARIHPKPGETVGRHLQYVQARKAFRVGSLNVLVNHRLQLIEHYLEHFSATGLHGDDGDLMKRCIDKALEAMPVSQWHD